MFKEFVSFESFALFVFIVALGAGMAWRQMRWSAKPLEDSRDQREEDDKATQDFRDALAQYNDTEHGGLSGLEPFCGAGDAQDRSREAVIRAREEADRQARSRRAVRRAQEAARASKSSSAAEHDVFLPVTAWGSSALPASSNSSSSSSHFSGSGGSFDGGGASGDWGGLRSSSSSSSDCSSSSSDSGGGSCGGSSD